MYIWSEYELYKCNRGPENLFSRHVSQTMLPFTIKAASRTVFWLLTEARLDLYEKYLRTVLRVYMVKMFLCWETLFYVLTRYQ